MAYDAQIIAFLKKTQLFSDLSDNEIFSILPFIHMQSYQKGDWITREGDDEKDIYLVMQGRAEVIKEIPEQKSFQVLGVLKSEEWAGEMAYFENKKRSASLRALEPSKILIFSIEKFHALANTELLYSKIESHFIQRMSQRLREANQNLTEAYEEKLKILRVNNNVSRSIVYFFIFIALYFYSINLFNIYVAIYPLLNKVFVPVVLIVASLLCFWLIKKSECCLDFFGLTLKNMWRNLIEAVLFSLPFIFALFIFKWYLVGNFFSEDKQPIFAHMSSVSFFILALVYTLLVPVQELLTRGIAQSYFREFFTGSFRIFLSILLPNLIFQAFHAVFDVWFALGSFVSGMFWGWLYERQKSLVGPIVSHALIGLFFLFFLDYLDLFKGV